MKKYFSLCVSLVVCQAVFAAEPVKTKVRAIDVLDKATMYSKTKVYLGVSCRTAPEGDMPSLKQVRLGDTVFVGKHSFKVGVIEAVSFSEDLKTSNGKVLAQKGETQCVLAADEKALPYEEKRCDALWMFVPKCRVIE